MKATTLRTAFLVRLEDVSGSSGTGIVGEIVQFSNGWCILFWLTETTSFKFFPDIESLDKIHSHEGRTRIVWKDDLYKLRDELDEGDPLLDLLRGIEDRRHAREMSEEHSQPAPVPHPEANLRKQDPDAVRVLQAHTRELRTLHRLMTEATDMYTMGARVAELGTELHELELWFENNDAGVSAALHVEDVFNEL